MLNAFWGVVVSGIDAGGGVIEHLRGRRHHGHLQRGRRSARPRATRGRAATAIVDAARPLAADHPGWPIFRVGVNTGPAVVGDVGAEERRSFAVIGDTINTAARLMAAAEPGQIVVGRSTWEALGPDAVGQALARPVMAKGKREAVEAWRLVSL